MLEPGEETQVSATFSLTRRQGPQSKTVTVESNDPETPRYQLKLTGTAVAAVMLEPQAVNFGRITGPGIQTETVTVRAVKEEVTFNITEVDTRALPGFEAEQKTLEKGKAYQITLRSTEPIKPGRINGRIHIRTDNKDYPIFQVRVYGQAVGEVDVLPDQVTLRYDEDPDKRATQYLRVLPGRTKEFQVTGAIAPVDDMEVEIQKVGDNDYRVKLAEMPTDETLEGKELILKTDIEATPEIAVPFRLIKPRTRHRRPPVQPAAPPKPVPAKKPAPATTESQ